MLHVACVLLVLIAAVSHTMSSLAQLNIQQCRGMLACLYTLQLQLSVIMVNRKLVKKCSKSNRVQQAVVFVLVLLSVSTVFYVLGLTDDNNMSANLPSWIILNSLHDVTTLRNFCKKVSNKH